jgi:tetratricopeptide (TPR) repeat protein
LLLFALLELGLRLAGWGYPTSFFLKVHQHGRRELVENPRYGWRFFPPALARSPQPCCLAADKPRGALRLFVLGESAAMGDPAPAFGFARQLERLLQARHPDRRIEVVNAAMTAINSHTIRDLAPECAGDCWLIYAGNNEVVGPFGAGTVFGRQALPLPLVRAALALKRTRVGQLVDRCLHPAAPPRWEGLELFLQHQVHRDDPRLERVYRSFAANLAATVQSGKKSGARVLLSTVAVNLLDNPPFASRHGAGLAPAAQAAWERNFQLGLAAQRQGHLAAALAAYQQAARLDPDFAELAFCRARCERALGQTNAAHADFQLACDLDTLRFRADSRLNQIIRQTAAAQNVRLVDAELELARRSPGGVPGEDLFYDHVHLHFSGNYALATLFVPAVEAELFALSAPTGSAPASKSLSHLRQEAVPPAASPPPPLLAESEVARRLAFTDFDRRRALEEMRLRLQQPPFTSQSNFHERDERLKQALAATPTPLSDLLPHYRAALALAPYDWVLHANFARCLEAIARVTAHHEPAEAGPSGGGNPTPSGPAGLGQDAQARRDTGVPPVKLEQDAQAPASPPDDTAAAHRQAVARLLPHEPEAWFHLGNLAEAAGRYGEAASLFREALARKPDCVEALNGLGLVLAAQGRNADAVRQFDAALRFDPRSTAARVNLAVTLGAQGKLAAAAAQYRAVLSSDTNNVGARVNLARLLARQGQTDQAMTLYTEALQLDPQNAVAHHDLANALSAQGRYAEAAQHYAAAVQSQPDFAPARYNLAIEQARLGQTADALREFAEVVRLRPDWADARFNYGIALAKAQRYHDAVREFRQTLQLQPDHAPARAALERALKLDQSAR